MITSSMGKVNFTGSIAEIAAEFLSIRMAFNNMVEKEFNKEEAEIFLAEVENADRYSTLCESGMSVREAIRIIAPDTTEDIILAMEEEERKDNEQK